jgi:ABC-type Fe3+-citrate transport system substrate-binding protein
MRESQKGQENERNIIMNTNNHKILSNQINKVNSTLELLSSSVESSLDNEINIIATIRSSLNHTHREREREREKENGVQTCWQSDGGC